MGRQTKEIIMEIEATWEVKPKSGVTMIDLIDLGCKSKQEWDALGKEAQRKLINAYLVDSDQSSLKVLTTEWSVGG